MATYFPLIIIGLGLAVITITLAWPWLKQPKSRDKAVMLCIVGTALSLALYMAIGNPFTIQEIQKQQSFNSTLMARINSLKNELEVSDTPDSEANAGKWMELGASYMQIERYENAANAFRHGVLASNGDPRVILAYGKAQMLAADGEVTEGAERAFLMADALMPDNPEPLFLLAIGKMQAGDRDGARTLFKELLPKLPEDSPLRQQILMQLQKSEENTSK